MADSVQVAAFEGGVLRFASSGEVAGEIVLALPLSRFVVRMVRVPADQDAVAFSTGVLSALSPYPDEPLTVSCEVVRETENGSVVIAAALPESSTDDIAAALDERKLGVTRIDILALGALRQLWTEIGAGETGARRLLVLRGADCLSLAVLDDDEPVSIRAVSMDADLRREAMLCLLEAEDFGGARALNEVVVIGDVATEALAAFAPVRALGAGIDLDALSLAGVAERAADPTALDALPASWRQVLEETRFKAKLFKGLAIAGGVWALVMAVLFGVPVAYGFMTDHQKSLSREHKRQYEEVKGMEDKVSLVRKYSDHARGALEIMKLVSDRLPCPDGADTSCIELSNWNFKRDEGVSVQGEAEDAGLVYQFKEALETAVDEEGNRLFGTVALKGPSATKNGQKFGIDCRFESEEEEP